MRQGGFASKIFAFFGILLSCGSFPVQGEEAALSPDHQEGIHRLIGYPQLKVKMGAGGIAGGAHRADLLTLPDKISLGNLQAVHMKVKGFHAGSVLNGDGVAGIQQVLSENNPARPRRLYRRSGARSHVGAGVTGGSGASVGIPLDAVGGADPVAVQRLDEGAVPVDFRIRCFIQGIDGVPVLLIGGGAVCLGYHQIGRAHV